MPPSRLLPGWGTTFYNLRAASANTYAAGGGAAAPAALPLPGCQAGEGLNLVGSFAADGQVGGSVVAA